MHSLKTLRNKNVSAVYSVFFVGVMFPYPRRAASSATPEVGIFLFVFVFSVLKQKFKHKLK